MRFLVPVSVVLLLLACGVAGFLVVLIGDSLHLPRWMVGMVVLPLAGWLLYTAAMFPLRRKALNELRALPVEELEARTFRYPAGYFQFLGESAPAVVRFKELVDTRDVQALRREWRGLEKQFRALEVRAGHKGRPLIMDQFHWFDLNLRALAERSQGRAQP